MAGERPFYFLEGEGEMATLTRNFDWSSTSAGAPSTWPEALRCTVAMILQSRFPMFLWWGDDMVQFYNDAYRPSLGNNGKHPAALGQRGAECWPEIWHTIFPLIEQVRTTGKATWNEDMLVPIYRNGKIEDAYWTFGYSPIRIETGEIRGVLVVCTETTEKVQGLQEITASENNTRTLIMQSPVAMGLFTGDDMVVELINDRFLEIWGKDRSVAGKPLLQALPEMKGQEYPEIMMRVYKTGEPYYGNEAEVYLEHEGQMRLGFYNFINAPYRDNKGNITGIIVVANEVTREVQSRRQIQQMLDTLAESETNFRSLILKAPVAMCLLNGPDHVIEVANDKIVELWGKDAEAVMGKPVFEALPDVRDQGLEQLLNHVYETGETYEATEMPVQLLRNGVMETVYQNFVYQAYRDGNGRIKGVIAITLDVTPQVVGRQKIEEVVEKRTAELQRSNAELAQFAYVASHDLQEPVRKVLTYADLLRRHIGDLDERCQGYFEKITRSAVRMQALIRDVLTYSEFSKTERVKTLTDLNRVMEDTITDFELVIEQKEARIEVNGLPEIVCDPLQMSQLFGNLLSNALKFVPSGIRPVIAITCKELGAVEAAEENVNPSVKWYSIRISDNGIGFDPHHASQLFRIFQRLHTRKEFDGTGIGLALCRRIAENHQGSIRAESRPGHGSTFTVLLPEKPYGQQ